MLSLSSRFGFVFVLAMLMVACTFPQVANAGEGDGDGQAPAANDPGWPMSPGGERGWWAGNDPLVTFSSGGAVITDPAQIEQLLQSLGMAGTACFPAACCVQVGTDGELHFFENGAPLPAERLRREGSTITVLDGQGNPALSFTLTADGALIAPPDSMVTTCKLPAGLAGDTKFLGIGMGPVDPALAAQLGIRAEDAVIVMHVEPDMPAARAGVSEYDVITHINSQAPATPEILRRAITATADGDKLHLRVLRAGRAYNLECDVVDRAKLPAGSNPFPGTAGGVGFGTTPPIVQWQLGSSGAAMSETTPEAIQELVQSLLSQQDAAGGFTGMVVPPAVSPGLEARVAEMEQRLSRIEETANRLADLIERALAEPKRQPTPK